MKSLSSRIWRPRAWSCIGLGGSGAVGRARRPHRALPSSRVTKLPGTGQTEQTHFTRNELNIAKRKGSAYRRAKSTRPNQAMAGNYESRLRPQRRVICWRGLLIALWLLGFGAGTLTSRAEIQFDVFLGYDSIVPEAAWFPVVCEIKNDGPPFVGTVELDGGRFNQAQTRRAVVELPTGTLKRFVIPVFSTSSGLSSWDVRLLDERGKVRGEQLGLRPKRQVAAGTPLLGAVVRTPAGTPTFRPILSQQAEFQPAAARLLPSIFPDNPVVLEGLSCIYLSSEKAADLTVNQVKALFDWLNGGGHLIVGVEQISEITATPWLRSVLPCALNDFRAVQSHPELQEWLQSATWPEGFAGQPRNQAAMYGQPNFRVRPGLAPRRMGSMPPIVQQSAPPQLIVGAADPFKNLPDDSAFENTALQVAVGEVRDGQVVVTAGDKPLID